MEPEDREFMRELLLRHEEATDAMVTRLNDASAESRRHAEEARVRTDQLIRDMTAHRREFVAEMRAQRQALFRILDRLDGRTA
jgi:hypothetical protein